VLRCAPSAGFSAFFLEPVLFRRPLPARPLSYGEPLSKCPLNERHRGTSFATKLLDQRRIGF